MPLFVEDGCLQPSAVGGTAVGYFIDRSSDVVIVGVVYGAADGVREACLQAGLTILGEIVAPGPSSSEGGTLALPNGVSLRVRAGLPPWPRDGATVLVFSLAEGSLSAGAALPGLHSLGGAVVHPDEAQAQPPPQQAARPPPPSPPSVAACAPPSLPEVVALLSAAPVALARTQRALRRRCVGTHVGEEGEGGVGRALAAVLRPLARTAASLASALACALPRWGPLGGFPPTRLSITLSCLHARLVDVGLRLPHDLTTAMSHAGAASVEERSAAFWDATDLLLRCGVDVVVGAVVATWLLGHLPRGQASVHALLSTWQGEVYRRTLVPWLASIAGTGGVSGEPLPDAWRAWSAATGAGHAAGRHLAAALLAAVQWWGRVSDALLFPHLAAALHCILCGCARYGLGLSLLLSALLDGWDVVTSPLHLAACAFGFVYAAMGRTLLTLWRLFRGKKRNVLRLRVDTADAGVPQLLVSTLLFVPPFLLLPLLAAHYALLEALWLTALALRAVLWWSLTLVSNAPWGRLLGVVLPLHWLGGPVCAPPCVGLGVQRLPVPPSAAPAQWYRLHRSPASLLTVACTPVRLAWKRVALVVTFRDVLLSALTGQRLVMRALPQQA